MKYELTDAENLFFDLIADGEPVTNKTTSIAECGRTYSTVVRRMGLTDGKERNPAYTGPIPVPVEIREKAKRLVLNYVNEFPARKQRNKRKQNQSYPLQKAELIKQFTNDELIEELERRFQGVQKSLSFLKNFA